MLLWTSVGFFILVNVKRNAKTMGIKELKQGGQTVESFGAAGEFQINTPNYIPVFYYYLILQIAR